MIWRRVNRRVEELVRTIPGRMREGESIPIQIDIGQNPSTSTLGIVMNHLAIIFIGSLTKAIIDSLSGEFQALLSSPIGNEIVEKR